MEELERPAIEQLIYLYTKFLDEGLSQEVVSKAKEIYNELVPANTLLSPTVNHAVGKLFSIGYPNIDSNRSIPTRDEVKVIIENLKKRKQELEKEQ